MKGEGRMRRDIPVSVTLPVVILTEDSQKREDKLNGYISLSLESLETKAVTVSALILLSLTLECVYVPVIER